MKKFNLQQFAAPTNTTVSTDFEPAISVDFTSRISENIKSLSEVLGVTELTPMPAGTQIKTYKMTQKNTPEQVAEGETIPLTEIERKPVSTIELTLQKYRRNTTAEAIQKVGKELAINKSDEKLISSVQKGIKKDFFTTLATGSGKATGTNLQTALANLWAELQKRYEDTDTEPIFFVNPTDIAEYLGTATVTTQTAFGFSYIESFLGLGTVIVAPQIKAKEPIATVKENLNGAYVSMSGDVAASFGLTPDATGYVGMTHSVQTSNASIDTLLMSCAKFFPEYADGVFKATITSSIG